MYIAPLRLELAVAVEHLDPVILAVGNIDPPVGITMNVVRQVEFTLTNAAFAPGEQVFPVWGELMHLGVAISVGHIDLAFGRQSGMRTATKRLATHEGGRLTGDADGHQHLAIERAFSHAVGTVVSAEYSIVGRHVYTMSAREKTFAP